MPCTSPSTTFKLPLSGNLWYIRAGDTEASTVVKALGEAMSLPPATLPPRQDTGEPWRELRVITDPGQNNTLVGCYDTGPVFCLLPSPLNSDRIVIGMSLIALAIARAELSRDGLLIHGALAAVPNHIGGGIILAGLGEVGKTTASNRLPPTWKSLSDDTSLVLCDKKGQYWAHPWPTWSNFFRTKEGMLAAGGNWDVQKSLPLRAIYFLQQSKEDTVAHLPTSSAVTYLMETVQLVSSLMTWDLHNDQVQTLHQNQLTAVEKLINSIPAYALHLSLTGTFWKNIEKTLFLDSKASSSQEIHAPEENTLSPQEYKTDQAYHDNDTITVCYSGSSMYPALRHPDLLEVLPYADKTIRPGDVVYYPSPINGLRVVHRVVRVTPDGISTRGDNNLTDDSYLLQQNDIVGRVVAAWRYGKYRKIVGGTWGIRFKYWEQMCNQVNGFFSSLLHGMYHRLASSGLLLSLLPSPLRPRVIEFKQRYQPPILKILFYGHVIGHYDSWKNHWVIDRPWRLIVDDSKLPEMADSHSMETESLNNVATNNKVPSLQAK